VVSVVLASIVANVADASEALAWMLAIFVALLFVLSASLVSLDASSTNLLRDFISLQRDLSVIALVVEFPLTPLARVDVANANDRKIVANCMFEDGEMRNLCSEKKSNDTCGR
jgi:hypothetical protein